MRVVGACAFAGLCLLLALPVHAQEAPAEQNDVLRALRTIRDETAPLTFRAQEVSRLLLSGDPAALDGLREVLRAADASREIRLAVMTGALARPDLALFEDVLDALLSAEDPALAPALLDRMRLLRAAPLLARLAKTAASEAADAPRRLLAVRLLGRSGTAEAAAALADLWAKGGAGIAEGAREAFAAILPGPFGTAEEAKAFLAEHRGQDVESMLRDILREAGAGAEAGGAKRLLEFARRLADQASLANLVDLYLACRDLPEVRRLGAERIAAYPFETAEGPAGRSLAAAGVLGALAEETDPPTAAALLLAARTLAETIRIERAEEGFERASAALAGADPEVRRAAVDLLGELRDPRAVERLRTLYDGLGAQETDLRLEILGALEKIGNGIAGWVDLKLRAGDPEEAITVRLIQLLKAFPKDREAIPTLIDLLRSAQSSEKIRREVASTLGIVGVTAGDEGAIDALAVFGLVDADQSVRVIAATQLGRAVGEVSGKVVELLRQRVGEAEPSARVRLAAARSLLKLRGEAAVADIARRLKDDEFWKDAVRTFLKTDLIGAGQAAQAARFVRAIGRAGLSERTVEAARLVLEARELEWKGDAEGMRGEVALDLARGLADSGRPEEALRVLIEEVPEDLPSDPGGTERVLLRAALLRRTGEPGSALALLDAAAPARDVSPALAAALLLERARCLIDAGRTDEVADVLAPLLKSPEFAEAAKDLLDAAAGRRPGPGAAEEPAVVRYVRALDGADPRAREEAMRGLREMGRDAYPALLGWLHDKGDADLPAAVAAIEAITGVKCGYDAAASAEERRKSVEDLRRALR